ncbi:hypothetical protein U1Q18_019414 [Sarracenia purpurea var. burkii]
MSITIPKTLALMAVQRQTAAARSASPSIREQQGLFGGVPTTRLLGGGDGHGTGVELSRVKRRRLKERRSTVVLGPLKPSQRNLARFRVDLERMILMKRRSGLGFL